jgi:tetratricopeptide (TPR) repeat protein
MQGELAHATTAQQLRSLEARAAAAYWGAWALVKMAFARKDRTTMPEHWTTFGTRSSPPTNRLYMVLKKREGSEELTWDDIQIAEDQGQFDFVADWYKDQYMARHNLWDLVKMTSALREAKKLELAAEFAKGEIDQHNIQFPPVWTSYGAALADLEDLKGAEHWAWCALELKESRHRHNLLGRVYFLQGDFGRGEDLFVKAHELDPSVSLRWEMEGAIKRSDESTRRETAQYLLEKDPVKYSWAYKYLEPSSRQ